MNSRCDENLWVIQHCFTSLNQGCSGWDGNRRTQLLSKERFPSHWNYLSRTLKLPFKDIKTFWHRILPNKQIRRYAALMHVTRQARAICKQCAQQISWGAVRHLESKVTNESWGNNWELFPSKKRKVEKG